MGGGVDNVRLNPVCSATETSYNGEFASRKFGYYTVLIGNNKDTD